MLNSIFKVNPQNLTSSRNSGDMVVSCPVYLWGEPGVDDHVLEGEQDVGGVVRTSLALPVIMIM